MPANWRHGYGILADAEHYSGDADGDVDGQEFLVWQQQFGSSSLHPVRLMLCGKVGAMTWAIKGPSTRTTAVLVQGC
jgi:hypothetical protein